MARIPHIAFILIAAVGLAAIDGALVAQPKDKDRKEQKVKEQKHQNGKNLVGEKIKKNGKQQFHKNGKHTAFVDVKDGKIAGVSVKHAEKGDVTVKKYMTKKKMAEVSPGGIQRVSYVPAQYEYLGMTWIGYAYIDDWGYEVIYWFPYDMVYDSDTGAIEYIPIV